MDAKTTTSILSIEAYDQAEALALRTACYPAIRAFTPRLFQEHGFPTRVRHEDELRRYADIMSEVEPRGKALASKLFTDRERAAILYLSDQIEDLTGRLFHRPVQPLMGLFGPMPIMRMVEHLSAVAGRRLTVMDVGSGAGYLAAYMVNAGHRVISTDVTQALYLWQNRLFGDYDLSEWAGRWPDSAKHHTVTHVPWWHFAKAHEFHWIDADIVVCEAALGEMDHWAFLYIIALAKKLLEKSPVGCLLYTNIGEEMNINNFEAEAHAVRSGYTVHKIGAVTTWSANSDGGTALRDLKAVPSWGSGPYHHIADFLTIDKDRLLGSYAWCDFAGIGR